MNKKGVAGLPLLLSVITMLFVIGMVVFIFVLMSVGIYDSAPVGVAPPQDIGGQDSITSLWSFDDGYLDLDDEVGSNDLTRYEDFVATINNVSGVVNGAFLPSSGNNANTWFNTGITFDGTQNTTASFWWYNYGADANARPIFKIGELSSGHYFAFGQSGTNSSVLAFKVYTGFWGHVYLETLRPASQGWNLYTMSYNKEDGTLKLWVEDTPKLLNNLSAGSTNFGATVDGLYILGNSPTTPTFTGGMDEVFITDDVWTQTEVDFTYDGGLGVDYFNLPQPIVPETPSQIVINDTKNSIAGVTDWFPIIIVIMAMVVLILLTIIIINAIRRSGLVSTA